MIALPIALAYIRLRAGMFRKHQIVCLKNRRDVARAIALLCFMPRKQDTMHVRKSICMTSIQRVRWANFVWLDNTCWCRSLRLICKISTRMSGKGCWHIGTTLQYMARHNSSCWFKSHIDSVSIRYRINVGPAPQTSVMPKSHGAFSGKRKNRIEPYWTSRTASRPAVDCECFF